MYTDSFHSSDTTSTPCSSASVHRLPSSSAAARQAFPKQLSDKYRLGEELGRGAFGQVFRGLDTRTGEQVAIKQLSLERIPSSQLSGIISEVELLKALHHRNVVTYLGSFRTRSHLYIIMELVENGSLAAVVKASNFGPFPEALVAVYIQQVLQGLAYLHDQGVVHRDIKGANILTTKEGLVKLADFGVAARLADGTGVAGADGAVAKSGAESSPAGTPYWMAPEVVELKTVTAASDIWSVGCLAIELLTGQPPYYDLQPLSALYNIVQDPHPPLPAAASPPMRDFLLQCFNKDPAGRSGAKALLQHRWITDHRRSLRSTWGRTRGRGGGGGRPTEREAHASVASVVENILRADSSGATSSSTEVEEGGGGGDGPAARADSLADSAVELSGARGLSGGAAGALQAAAQQEHFLAGLQQDPCGSALLNEMEALSLAATAGGPSNGHGNGSGSGRAAPQDEGEVRRQVASLRILAAPGARSLIEEAAAAASARALVGYLSKNPALVPAFLAADGVCGLRELVDSPSDRVLIPALDLLLVVTSRDATALQACCNLGLIPAVLRLAGPHVAVELRLKAARFAHLLACSSEGSVHALVSCQGVAFVVGMMDDVAQSQEQVELLRCAVGCLWAILRRSLTPSWPVATNQYLRLMAHHGLPLRLVKTLPWVLKHATSATCAARAGHHARSSSAPIPPSDAAPANGGLRSTQSVSPQSSWAAPAAAGSMRGLRPSNRVVPEDDPLLLRPSGQSDPGTGPAHEPPAHQEAGLPALLESMVTLFAALTHGDTVVKSRCCHVDTINPLFGLTTRMAPPLQLRILTAVRRLSTDQAALQPLDAANAISYVVAQLPRVDAPALQSEALCALHNLCQLNKGRQERAAVAGAVPWLCRLAMQPPAEAAGGVAATAAARASAISVLCGLAHCSPRSRAEVWSHGGLDILVALLKEEAHQGAVMEALAAWLDAELPRVEERLLEGPVVGRLLTLLPPPPLPAAEDRLPRVLSPLCRMVSRSPRLAVALASAGLAARAAELLQRPPPPTALALLELLRLMYESHPNPKEFIAKNRLAAAVGSLAQGAGVDEQVLVRRQAQTLLQAFSVNSIF